MGVELAAAVAGGASLLGGVLANRSRSKEAQKDRNFQERMSSTSWQRGKADMEAAGINPALAYAKGGASSPGGAMAGVENVTEGAVSSALQAKRLTYELRDIKASADLKRLQGFKERELASLARSQAERNAVLEANDVFQGEVLRLQLPWANASAKAIERFPQAAMLQLILNSGGTQALGLTGLGAASTFLRRGRR